MRIFLVIVIISSMLATACEANLNLNSTRDNRILEPIAPVFDYTTSQITLIVGNTITEILPNIKQGTNLTFSISPSLPSGLIFNGSTGGISGAPQKAQEEVSYTVTAVNSKSSATAVLKLQNVLPLQLVSESKAARDIQQSWKTETLSDSSSLKYARFNSGLIGISDDRILLIGGADNPDTAIVESRSFEVFDFKTMRSTAYLNAFSSDVVRPKAFHVDSNRIVVFPGGTNLSVFAINPSTLEVTQLADMSAIHNYAYSAVQLQDKQIVLIGGYNSGPNSPKVERYDASGNGLSTPLADMNNVAFPFLGSCSGRGYSAAWPLVRNGVEQVVVVGGYTGCWSSNHRQDVFTLRPTDGLMDHQFTDLTAPTTGHGSVQLPDGSIVIFSGHTSPSSVSRYNFSAAGGTGAEVPLTPMAISNLIAPDKGFLAKLTKTGKVLLLGGRFTPADASEGTFTDQVQIYDPSGSGSSQVIGRIEGVEQGAEAVELSDGRILIYGGWNEDLTNKYTPKVGLISPYDVVDLKKYITGGKEPLTYELLEGEGTLNVSNATFRPKIPGSIKLKFTDAIGQTIEISLKIH